MGTTTIQAANGVHSDPHSENATGKPTQGPDDDDFIKREMAKCQGSAYDFFTNNCCHRAEQALRACRVLFPVRDWPNWPIIQDRNRANQAIDRNDDPTHSNEGSGGRDSGTDSG
jgi:hypothetical protein